MKLQLTKPSLNTTLKFLALIPIPLLFFLLGVHILHLFGPPSVRSSDPDFLYYYNCMCMGLLKLDLGHIDNPGTPLQVWVAIVTRIAHLLIGENSYTEDLLSRPDLYIQIISYTIYIAITVLLLLVSIKVYSKTGSLLLAIGVQLIPLIDRMPLFNLPRILPETVMIVPVLFLTYYLLVYIYDRQFFNSKPYYFKIVVFACISGFGLALKFDYLPLIVAPVFIFSGIKEKLFYLLGTIVAFLLFAFSVLWNLNFFIRWTLGLFIHSGRHGSGEANILDISSFWTNLAAIHDRLPNMGIILAFGFIAVLFSILPKFRKSSKTQGWIVAGFLISFILHIIMVAKHYQPYYLFPIVYLTTPMIIISFLTFNKNGYLLKLIMLSVLLYFTYSTIDMSLGVRHWKKPLTQNKMDVNKEVKALTMGKPFAIVRQPYNVYFAEDGLLIGWFFTGKHKPYFRDELVAIYPDTYNYDWSRKSFFYWGEFIILDDIIAKHDEIYVFIQNQSKKPAFDEITSHLDDYYEIDTVYTHPVSQDQAYRFYHREQ